MSGEINVLSRTQIITVDPTSGAISIINAGPQGVAGPTSTVPGPAGPTGPVGPAGGVISQHVVIHAPNMAQSAAATNNTTAQLVAVSDPVFRHLVDLRGLTKVRVEGKFTPALATTTKLVIQYHPSGDINIATGDAGWATLCVSAGGHTVNVPFYTSEATVPSGAQVNPCVIRPAILDGDGVADPCIAACILNFYN